MKNYFKKENFLIYIPYIILFCILFLLHLLMPIFFGDYQNFSKVLNGDYSQIFNVLISRYGFTSSRTLIEFFLIPLTLLPGIIWQILDSLILVGIAFLMGKIALYLDKLDLFNNENYSEEKNKEGFFIKKFMYNIICCFVFLFAVIGTFMPLTSAGVMATSVNYSWPLFFGMLNFYLVIKYFFKNKNKNIWSINRMSSIKKIFIYFLLIFSLLFAISHEIVLCIMLGIYIFTIIYCRFKNIKIPKIIYYILGIAVIGLAYMLLSPGNTNRYAFETAAWFPTYYRLNFFDKILIGPTSLLSRVVTLYDLPTFLFSLMLGVYTYCISNKKKLLNTIIGFIPMIILSVFYTISLLGFSSIINWFKGGITQYGLLFSDLNIILLYIILFLIIILSILYTLIVIFKNKKITISYAILSLLLLSTGSIIIMGFSPTVWASGLRWYTFYYFFIVFAALLMVVDLYLTGSLKKLKNFKNFLTIPISLLLFKISYQQVIESLKIVQSGMSHGGIPNTLLGTDAWLHMVALSNFITLATLYLVFFIAILFNVYSLCKYILKNHAFIISVIIVLGVASIGILSPIRHYPENWFIYCTIILILNTILFVINYRNRRNKRKK